MPAGAAVHASRPGPALEHAVPSCARRRASRPRLADENAPALRAAWCAGRARVDVARAARVGHARLTARGWRKRVGHGIGGSIRRKARRAHRWVVEHRLALPVVHAGRRLIALLLRPWLRARVADSGQLRARPEHRLVRRVRRGARREEKKNQRKTHEAGPPSPPTQEASMLPAQSNGNATPRAHAVSMFPLHPSTHAASPPAST